MGGWFSRPVKPVVVVCDPRPSPPPPPKALPPPRPSPPPPRPSPPPPPKVLRPPPPPPRVFPAASAEDLAADARKELGMDIINQFNFAFVGQSGSGKSSFINAVRQLKDTHQEAAPVGETETTLKIRKYPHPTHTHVVLWDFPGSGTAGHRESTYFEDNMLYAFDCIMVLTSDRFMKVDFEIAKKAREFKRPCAIVRTKADAAVKSIAEREEKTMLDSSKDLRLKVDESFRKGLKDSGFSADTSFEWFIVTAHRFRSKHAYTFYNKETCAVDTSLNMMDEDRLLAFVTNSAKPRLPWGTRGLLTTRLLMAN